MNVHDDAPWKAPEIKTRSARSFLDGCDVTVTDEDGLLSCSLMIKAMNTLIKERLLTNLVWPVNVCARLHDEPNLHLEFYQRTVTDEMQSHWHLPLMVSQNFPECGYSCEEN